MLTLYDYLDSGNGYKARLLLAQLGLAYRLVQKDILQGETRTPEFLRINPDGRIPVLQLEDGTCLPESSAILWYLAEGTPYLSHDRLERAQTLRWLSFEQYSHEPNIATLRFWRRHFDALSPAQQAQVPGKLSAGEAALGVMEAHLAEHDWFVGGRYSISDIALYAYTHVAQDGGFDLTAFPAIQSWLARVVAQPGHVPML